MRAVLEGHESRVISVAVAFVEGVPWSSRAAKTGRRAFFDLASGRQRAVLGRLEDRVTAVAVAEPDGAPRIIAAARDAIHIFDLHGVGDGTWHAARRRSIVPHTGAILDLERVSDGGWALEYASPDAWRHFEARYTTPDGRMHFADIEEMPRAAGFRR